MGATYTRQSSYTDGDVITAAHTNDEFNQLLAAFAASSGHTHDGTAAEGGPITKLLGNTLTFGAGTAGTDITITFDGETSDGVLLWKEDEDYFEFSDDILIASTEKLQFRDTAIYINSSADGQLDLVADTEIQIAATTIDINGNADISGNLGIGGNLTVTGTTTFNGGTMTLGDAATDNVVFGADVDSNIIPDDDNTYDLGSSSQQWKDIYIDGVAYLDAIDFNGTAISATAAELNIMDGVTATTAELNILDGVTSTATELNIMDGNTSASSTTVVDADRVVLNDGGTMKQVAVTDLSAYFDDEITAMPNLTSVGTLSTLTVDNVIINGTTIGHTDDTDLITLASGSVTIAGDLTISGDDLTMGTNTSGHILVADGTNFNPVAVGDLSEISTVANDDVFLAVDTSGGGLKKVTRSTIVSGLAVGGVALSNVVEDTTPQLGGSLDVNGQDIVSVSNGNITLTPNGTGVVRLDGNVDIQSGLIDLKNSGAVSKIKFYCESSNAHAQTVQGAPHSESASNTLTLPSSGGDARLVSTSSTATLTNKTLTTPIIAEIDATSNFTLDAGGNITLDADGGTITFSDGGSSLGTITSSGYSGTAAVATTAVVTDSTANTNFPVVFHNESNGLLDDTGALRYNPSTGTLLVPNLSVAGTTTTVDTVTMNAANAVVFEGATADAHETTLTIVDPTADRTINLPNVSGTLPVLAAVSTTQISSTPEELNILDGVTATTAEINIMDGVTATTAELNTLDGITAVVGELNALDLGSTAVGTAIASKAVILDSNKDYTGIRNFTITGELDAATLDISGDADIDGTLETDALSINGTTVTSTAAELNILDGATATVTELNIMDGDTSATSTTLVDADRVVTNDNGTMKQVSLSDVKTYLSSAGFSTDDPTALAIALG